MKKEVENDKLNLFIPLSVIFLLFVGVIISVIQVQHQQNQRTRASQSSSVASNDCTVDALRLSPSANEAELLTEINAYRGQYNLPPLTWNNELQKAAAWLSNDNMINSELSHLDSLGRNPSKRFVDCGYGNAVKIAENLDVGESNPRQVIEAWKRSQSHNTNLLEPIYSKAGISEVNNGSASYWTLTLGSDLATTQFPTVTQLPTQLPTLSMGLSPSVALTPTTVPTPVPTLIPQPSKTPIPTKRFTPTVVINPTPTIDPRYVPNANDTQVWVAIKFRAIGIGGNLAPRNPSRRVSVAVFDEENEKIKTGTGFVRFDGTDLFTGVIHLGKIPNSTYYIKITSVHTLQQLVLPQFQSLVNDRLNILPPVIATEGDFNDDNAMTLDDFRLALQCFQDRKCSVQPFRDNTKVDEPEPVYDFLDLNDDGKVDVYDYNLLLYNFSQQKGD